MPPKAQFLQAQSNTLGNCATLPYLITPIVLVEARSTPLRGRPWPEGCSSAASHGYAKPAIDAPIIGTTQNSQSCCSAHPPTMTAGPVLRAGLTDRFVTGIPIRWISVRPSRWRWAQSRPDALVGGPEDDHQEHEGEHDLRL